MMLDHQHSNRKLPFQILDKAYQFQRLIRIHAGCRFIQKKKLGICCHCTGNLQLSLMAIRKAAGQFVRFVIQAYNLQKFHGLLFRFFRCTAVSGCSKKRIPQMILFGMPGCQAITTLAFTDRLPNRRMFWKVRAMRQLCCLVAGSTFVISFPIKVIFPAISMNKYQVMVLKIVLLRAPSGPRMSPSVMPFSIFRLNSSIARTPPKMLFYILHFQNYFTHFPLPPFFFFTRIGHVSNDTFAG